MDGTVIVYKERDYRMAGLLGPLQTTTNALFAEEQSLLRKTEKQWSRYKPPAQPQQYKTVEIIGIEIKKSP